MALVLFSRGRVWILGRICQPIASASCTLKAGDGNCVGSDTAGRPCGDQGKVVPGPGAEGQHAQQCAPPTPISQMQADPEPPSPPGSGAEHPWQAWQGAQWPSPPPPLGEGRLAGRMPRRRIAGPDLGVALRPYPLPLEAGRGQEFPAAAWVTLRPPACPGRLPQPSDPPPPDAGAAGWLAVPPLGLRCGKDWWLWCSQVRTEPALTAPIRHKSLLPGLTHLDVSPPATHPPSLGWW